jgi:hypothetical protein
MLEEIEFDLFSKNLKNHDIRPHGLKGFPRGKIYKKKGQKFFCKIVDSKGLVKILACKNVKEMQFAYVQNSDKEISWFIGTIKKNRFTRTAWSFNVLYVNTI